jgi:hypothetical protein
MTAYNYERYVAGALRSVLAQEYPPQLLDVVVVDDGSTDGTAEIVGRIAAESGRRVMLIRQANAGLAAATQTALDHAGGELVAICDADDEWLPGKVRAQVDIFCGYPEVAVVYGDMQVIDESGAVLHRSFFARQDVSPRRGRVLDDLVTVNFTTNSTLMFRARDLVPIPAECPYADYWLVMHAAAAGELELVERPLANYRLHGSNMSFGAVGDRQLRESQRELMIRRLMLTRAVAPSVTPGALATVALELHAGAHATSRAAGVPLAEVVIVTDEQRRRAHQERERAAEECDPDARVRALAIALLLDPLSEHASRSIEFLAAALEQRRPAGDAPSGSASRAPVLARRITVASARELIVHPELMVAYCEEVASQAETTLVIVAHASAIQDTAARLRVSLTEAGIDPDHCPDMAIVAASELLGHDGRSLLAGARQLTPCPELQVSAGS